MLVTVHLTRTRSGLPLHHLDDAERQRAAAFRHERDRDRYVTAHLLMRAVVAQDTGVGPARQRYTRRCGACRGPHGALVAHVGGDERRIGLSYAGDRVALTVTTEPVGVDIELLSATNFEGFAQAALTADEVALHRHLDDDVRPRARATWWARKEALLKATGHGLHVSPTLVGVGDPHGPACLASWDAPQPPPSHATIADVWVAHDIACAVAALTPQPLTARARDATDLLAAVSREDATARSTPHGQRSD